MSTKEIIIEVEKMKDLYSGLGQYCQNLSNALIKLNNKISLYKGNKKHRFFPYLLPKALVWHGTHQDTSYIPINGKFVLTIHDFNQLYKDKSSWRHSLYRRKIQKKIARANHLVFISNFVKSEADRLFDLKQKPSTVIYNGVEVSDKTNEPKIVPAKEFLFTISALLPKKNIHSLLPMMISCKKDWQLIIAGKDNTSYAQQLRDQIKDLNLEDKVKMVGAVDEEEKYWYLKNCKAFVFPSLMEGFGIPVAEAMQMGKPVFLSDKTSLPEIAGEYGHYWKSFEPESMLKVLEEGLTSFSTDKADTQKIFASRYNWEKAAVEYNKVFEGLLS